MIKMSVRLPNKKDRLFLSGYAIYLFFQIIDYSFYSAILPGFLSITILLLCLGLFVAGEMAYGKLYKGKIYSYLAVIVLVGICAYLNFLNLSFIILVIFFGRNTNFKQICRVTILVTVIGLLFVFISAKLGVITDYYGYRGDGTKRSYLGFRYALFAPGFLINMFGAYIYLKNGRISNIKLILIAVFSLVLYKISDARLSFALSILMIASVFVYQNRVKRKHESKHKESIISKLIIPIFPFLTVLSVVLASLYTPMNQRWQMLDTLLTRRLQYSQRSMILYGIKLFGNTNIDWAGFSISSDGTMPVYSASMVYVDNVYIHILQRYGVVFSVLVLIALTYTMYILYKRKNYILQLLFVVFAIRGFIDNQVLYICFNVFLFAMFNEISTYTKTKKRERNLGQAYKSKSVQIRSVNA